MPKYVALKTMLLAHESRVVKEGEEFITDFPLVKGEPMRLGENIRLIEEPEPDEPAERRSVVKRVKREPVEDGSA